jgi:Cu/Ag efflux pump CusA
MTSLAFILGILPLVVASGAGSAARHSMGTADFGGMIISTSLNLLLIPVLYIIIMTLRENKNPVQKTIERRQSLDSSYNVSSGDLNDE